MEGREPIVFWVDEIEMGRAADPSLPPGVIALQDADGRWWRYPVAEFPAGSTREWSAPE